MKTIQLEISDKVYQELKASVFTGRLCHGSGASLESKVIAKIIEAIKSGEDSVLLKYRSEGDE